MDRIHWIEHNQTFFCKANPCRNFSRRILCTAKFLWEWNTSEDILCTEIFCKNELWEWKKENCLYFLCAESFERIIWTENVHAYLTR